MVTTPPRQEQAARSKTSSGQFEFQRPGRFCSGAFDGLLSYVRRDGREAKNSSPLGMRSEPEDIASNALLLKSD